MLTFAIHVNHTNLPLKNKKSFVAFFPVLLAGFFVNFLSYGSDFTYFIDWYTSQVSSYNDLLSQYIYLYQLNSYLTLIIGCWLLLLTFFIVLVLTASSNAGKKAGTLNYFFKRQSLWKQWGVRPFLKFFK